jgi:RNA polymerase sigma-70 factor (ECF subfamily)
VNESRTLRRSLPPTLRDELYRKADAERWGLTADAWESVVLDSARHAFKDNDPAQPDLERYLRALHLADLALAAACAQGRDDAWDRFVVAHRPVLYRAADALDPAGGAREIADALYAELYGVRGEGDERRSLFRYFHGRSSLSTWLRAVLAQRFIDGVRARKRTEPLRDDDRADLTVQAPTPDPDRARLVPLVERTLRAAITALAPKDRLRLRSYYVSQLTLAAIGRITGEHEATVSRQLARTRRALRAASERQLHEDHQLSRDEVARALELAVEDPGGLDLQQLITADRKKSPGDRSQ